MKPKRYTLKIENPCTESWADMTASGKGEFCSSCSKNVIDFTALSDKEIIKILEQSSGGICGRFNNVQLNRVMSINRTQRSYPIVYRLLTSLMLIPVPALVWAAEKPKSEIFSTVKPGEIKAAVIPQNQNPSSKPKCVFSGRVLDDNDHKGLPGAVITIKGTDIKTSTDQNGDFSITVPDSFKAKKVTFIISFVGFESIERTIKKERLPLKETVIFRLETITLGEIAMLIE